jgi:RimK family alpha-L-glutamate ligase
MRFAVVARSWTPTNVGLASCSPPGAESAILTPKEALAELEPGDLALGRLDVLETLDRVEPGLWDLHQLDERGVRVLNKPPTLLAAHDKLLTARMLTAANIAHPPTVHVSHPQAPVALDPPVVVKPRFGSWGIDVLRCDDEPALRTALRDLATRSWFASTGAIVQQLVPPQGFDLRIVVAGGRVVGAIERHAAPGEWRTNISLGGVRRSTVPTTDASALAIEASVAIGGDLIGVDLLPTEIGSWVVIELNSAVDFTPQYSLGGDVFRLAVTALTGLGDEAPTPA